MSANELQDIFGSDSDSSAPTPKGGLRISPDKDDSPPEHKSGSEEPKDATPPAPTTPVAVSDVDEEDEDNLQPNHTSGFTRVPSDNEDEGERIIKGEAEATANEDGTLLPSSLNEAEPEDVEEIRIEAAMCRLEPNFEGRFLYWKGQDLLRAVSEDFAAEAYDDEFEDFDEDPPPEIQQAMLQKVKATMRWRLNTTEDGEKIPESNTKFVTWSDGSSSLVIGDEYYDISFIPLKGEHHQLFLRQGTGLQGGVVLKEKMSIRPTNANPLRKSRAAAGQAASGSKLDDKSRRTNYMNQVMDKDPEKHRAELMKQEDQRLKETIRKETQQRRIRDRHPRGMTGSFLEGNDEEDDNSISLAAIKNSFKKGEYTHPVYSDEEDSETDTRRKKLETAKEIKDEDDDDEDDFAVKKKKTDEGTTKKRVALIKDDDESD